MQSELGTGRGLRSHRGGGLNIAATWLLQWAIAAVDQQMLLPSVDSGQATGIGVSFGELVEVLMAPSFTGKARPAGTVPGLHACFWTIDAEPLEPLGRSARPGFNGCHSTATAAAENRLALNDFGRHVTWMGSGWCVFSRVHCSRWVTTTLIRLSLIWLQHRIDICQTCSNAHQSKPCICSKRSLPSPVFVTSINYGCGGKMIFPISCLGCIYLGWIYFRLSATWWVAIVTTILAGLSEPLVSWLTNPGGSNNHSWSANPGSWNSHSCSYLKAGESMSCSTASRTWREVHPENSQHWISLAINMGGCPALAPMFAVPGWTPRASGLTSRCSCTTAESWG